MRHPLIPLRLAGLFGLLACTIFARAQVPQALVNAERAKLLDGVQSLPKIGTPGPVGIWGQLAFPVLAGPDKDGVELAVAAAAAHGAGRVILFGQNGYLSGNTGGDHTRFLENCVKWASNKDKPRIGSRGVRDSALPALGFKVGELAAVDKTNLSRHDVVILNIQGITSGEEGAALMDFVNGGGGLICGMTGWAFGQTSGGKDLALSHGVNQALMAAGLAITDMSAFDQLPAFEARAELPPLMNAAQAVIAIKQQREGVAQMTPEQSRQAMNAIQIALAGQPPERSQLRSAVLSALGPAGADIPLPSATAPLADDRHAAARLRLGMETRVLRLAAAGDIEPHPSHAEFPGKIPDNAPRVSGGVAVNPAIPGWHSTGLYAGAGEVITVTIPEHAANKGFAVRIGCHSDTLYHLDKWRRAPDITRSDTLATVTTRAASAFGGLIYIVAPDRPAVDELFTATIENAVPAALFTLGVDDDAAWRTIRERPAPWAELACGKIVITCPADVARAIHNPTELMTFWNAVVEAQDDITNQANERRRPERIVADVQISAGYMHSGYPIMIPTSAAPEMVTLNRLKFPGWGFYHEIGHNHQRRTFTFEGAGEVTNNVIGMYCYEAVLKKDWLIGHSNITAEARKEHIRKIKASEDKWQTWKNDPFLALTTYIQLVQAFGWESWRAYLHSFGDPAFGPDPTDDDEARDQFLTRYSKITRRNLGPFFDFWGIPFSAEARRAAAEFETWMPPDL
jgi:hypothetical protein